MADDGLEPLITECPGCHTRFRVAEAQLQRAGGKVRCGACLTVFHGIAHLTFESAQTYASEEQAQRALDALLDELAEPDGPPQAPAAGASGPRDDLPAALPQPPTARRQPPRGPIFSGFEEPDEPADEAMAPGPMPAYRFQVVGDGSGEGASVAVPELAQGQERHPASTGRGAEPAGSAMLSDAGEAAVPPPRRRARPLTAARPLRQADAPAAAGPLAEAAAEPARDGRGGVVFGEVQRRRPLVWLGIVLGLLLLGAQVLWYQFDDWANDPGWRGVYQPLCRVLGCQLPQQRDRSLLATRNLAVRSHPDQPDTLLVNAVIVNQAEFPQPFPVLELRFTTVRGMLVAGRRFEPEEYLAGDARGMKLIPPRTPVQVELTIDDPGPEAVNYFLQFR